MLWGAVTAPGMGPPNQAFNDLAGVQKQGGEDGDTAAGAKALKCAVSSMVWACSDRQFDVARR